MLIASVKGVAALSTAGLLLLGAGSVVRADLAPPAPGIDSSQVQQQAPDPSAAGALDPSSVTQGVPGSDSRDTGSGPSAPQRKPSAEKAASPATTVITPAPAGAASASVVRVNPIDTCLSCTSAEAGSSTAHARATAIRLFGQNVSAGEGGTSSGSLLALPANPLLGLAVADWETATSAGGTSTAHSRTAIVDLALGPSGGTAGHSAAGGQSSGGAITVAVLESTSDAAHQNLSSHGDGANNGVHVDVGNGALVIILLHSDASSSNPGSAYVVGINGAQLVSADQTGTGGIPITIPGVVGVILLQVGATGGSGSAAVGTVNDLLGMSGQAAGVLTSTAVGLTGLQAGPNAGTAPATGTAAATSPGLRAPATGAAMGLGGLLLLAGGGGLLGICLRRRRDGAQVG